MYLLDKIQALIEQQVVPVVSYAYLNHEQVLQDTMGVNTWKPSITQLPADPLYDLASLTKVIGTTTVLLHLIEQKKLSYDTPICQWLPQFSDSRVTLRHLMTHTSGIKGYIKNRDQLSKEDLLLQILQLPVTADFNRVIKYTDTGPILAGLIIEKIYQQPVQQVIEQVILKPLGLLEATFNPKPQRCVVTTTRQGQNLQGVVHDPKAQQLGEDCGSAGMFASLTDLVRFSQFMLGQLKIQQPPISFITVKSLYKSFTPVAPGRSFGWDLRWNSQHQPVLYHTGYTGNFWGLDWYRQQAVIVLSNRVHPFNDNQRFLAYREAIMELFLKMD
ncbi:serine hydrolase domain-containing protein [Bombilactobacillus bombi]|uniref:serine hydrolase domain-containing protein n=1 Tax=Bombilactobacillus bombi TaxID=1303590 RepID=UPI0015E5ABDA|nr:serine hydrolase domain-containing protein [Bombilactobacillus bombi]MBA1434741.1 class A beta-lactamase-related serine hydrolase [Bombilactobacillus bombi]